MFAQILLENHCFELRITNFKKLNNILIDLLCFKCITLFTKSDFDFENLHMFSKRNIQILT